CFFFFFQAEDGIRDRNVTGVQTCALPILLKTVFDEFSDDIIAASPVYSTPPWGVEDQDEFLNAVIIVDVEQTPLELLHRGQALEQAADRVRERHWGPRTSDVDIVEIEGS